MRRFHTYTLFPLFFFVILIQGCGARQDGLAPVEESLWRDSSASVKEHVVARGETLYAIAFRYDQDYHRLAVVNNLKSPYALRIGQKIKLKSSSSVENFAEHVVKALPSAPKLSSLTHPQVWRWPAVGRIKTTFAPRKGRKGIDIAGKKGSNIRASEAGVVAYAGSGLPGYGNLIILKHDSEYLTAYGNNQKNLVRSGQHVKQGQVIAKMGVVNRRYWGMHFEMRRRGEPVNPLSYLKKKA